MYFVDFPKEKLYMENAQYAHGFRRPVRLGEQGDPSTARTEPTAMAVRKAKLVFISQLLFTCENYP